MTMTPREYMARPKLFHLWSTKWSDDVISPGNNVISSTQPPSWVSPKCHKTVQIYSKLIKTNKETLNDTKM